MMVNMSDLGNQMGQMMRAGMQKEKAKHENEQTGKNSSNANHDPFNMADTMLGGIFLSLGGALGQTQRQITDKIAGSALGSAVGDLYSGSMLDTAVGGVSKGFTATRDYINENIETVKDWGSDLAESGMNLFKYGEFDTNDSKDVQMAIMREQASKMWESGEMDQEIMKNQSYRLWESGDMNRLVLAKYAKDVVKNFESDSRSETNAKIQAIKDIGIDTAMLDEWVTAKRAELAYLKALKEQQAAQNKESTLEMSYKDQIKMAVDNFSLERFGNGVKQGASNVVSGIKNLGKAAYKMANDSDYRDRAGAGLASLYDQQSALFSELGGEKYLEHVIDNVNRYREAANRAFLEDPGTKLGNLIGEEVATVGMGKFLKGSTAALKFQLTHASRVGIVDPDTAAMLGKLERKVAGQGAKGGKTDFYIKANGDVVPSTGYRYMSSDASYIDGLKDTMTIPENPKGTYFSFDKFDKPSPDRLQVPHDAAYRGSFDTMQIIDDVHIPKGNWGRADYLEPITKDFPSFGRGGATQATTYSRIELDELLNLLKE